MSEIAATWVRGGSDSDRPDPAEPGRLIVDRRRPDITVIAVLIAGDDPVTLIGLNPEQTAQLSAALGFRPEDMPPMVQQQTGAVIADNKLANDPRFEK